MNVYLKRSLTLLLVFILSLSILLAYNWWPTASRTPVALAHAYVIGSDPIDGSTVSTAPSSVRIFFNEAIGPASVAYVYAPDGHVVNAARSSIPRNNPQELDTPLASPNSLPQGGYTVRWTAISNEDGHTTHGVIGFNLGQSSVGLPGETILGPSTSNILPQLDLFGVLSVAWDWLVMLALTFWVGILVMEGLALARPTYRQEESASEAETSQSTLEQTSTLLTQARKQSLPLQWLALTVLLVGEIITLILRATLLTQTLGGSGINLAALGQVLFETNYGLLWLARFILIVVAIGLLWWTTRHQKTRTGVIEQGNVGATLAFARRSSTPTLKPATKRSKTRFSQLRQQVREQATEETDIASTDQEPANPAPSDQQGIDPASDSLTPPPLPPAPMAGASPVTTLARPGDAGPRFIVGPGLAPAITQVLLILAALILLTYAITSDAAQLAQPHISAVVLDWLYLAAQSTWFGTVAYLGYVLVPLLLAVEPGRQAETFASMLQRITPAALVMLGILCVSGLFLSESSLSSVLQLFTDAYGRALLVKIVLIVFMLILSGYTLFVIRPKLARQAALLPVVDVELPTRRTQQSALEQTTQRMGQALKLQSWLGTGVLLCAALMAFYAPPIVFPPNSYATSTAATAPSTASINAQTKQVGNLTVTLEVLPGRVDYDNTIIVTINDSHGNPVTDAQVQLSTNMEIMDMGTAHATVKGGNPTYIATFNKDAAFSMFGEWDITLRITRPNQAVVQTVFKVTLAG